VGVRDELEGSPRLLAAVPEDQLAHLEAVGSRAAIDELALESDHVLAGSRPAEGLRLSPQQLKAARAVHMKLDAMSGEEKAELWEPEALAARPEWAEVRQAAQRALALLG
jgi:hypothetical protein